jgi:hypothetical protein
MHPGRTLQELAVELERQLETRRDYVAHTPAMRVTPPDAAGEFGVTLPALAPMHLTDLTHDQLGDHYDIPRPYYRRLRTEQPEMLADHITQWLRARPEHRLLRTLDGRLRAFLSTRYRCLDNYDLAEAVLPVLHDRGVRVVSAELTERRLYLKAVNERLTREVKVGDPVQAGVVITNSEVGAGALTVQPMVYRLVCLNGAIASDLTLRKYHTGGRIAGPEDAHWEYLRDATRRQIDRALWMQIRDLTDQALGEALFTQITDRLAEAAQRPITGDPVRVVEVTAKRFGLTDQERGGVLRHLIAGGDLSQWGLCNAVTRVAQDVEDYDRATELERLGGALTELQPAAWHQLAQAA